MEYRERQRRRERMSVAEWNQMRSLLIKFGNLELDQFEDRQLETTSNYDLMRELPDEAVKGE